MGSLLSTTAGDGMARGLRLPDGSVAWFRVRWRGRGGHQWTVHAGRPHGAAIFGDGQGAVAVDPRHPRHSRFSHDEGGGGEGVGIGEAGSDDGDAEETLRGPAGAWIDDVLAALVAAAGGHREVAGREHRSHAVGDLRVANPHPPALTGRRLPPHHNVAACPDEEASAPAACSMAATCSGTGHVQCRLHRLRVALAVVRRPAQDVDLSALRLQDLLPQVGHGHRGDVCGLRIVIR